MNVLSDAHLEKQSLSKKDGDLSVMMNLEKPDIEEVQEILIKNRCADPLDLDFEIVREGRRRKSNLRATKCVSSELRAVVFRDSFFEQLLPYVAEHFGEAVYIVSYYDQKVMEQILDKFKPDVVIEEVVERNLKNRSVEKVLAQLSN